MQLFLTDPRTIDAIRRLLAMADCPLHIPPEATSLIIVDPKEYFAEGKK